MKVLRLAGLLGMFILLLAAGFALQAQDVKTSTPVSHFNASLALEEKGKYADALKEMEAIPAEERSDYAVLLRFGWLEYQTQAYDKSEKFYKQALTASSNKSIEALLGLTLPLAAKQNWGQVEDCYEKVLAMDPANYTARLRMGQIYMNRGDYATAQTHFSNALSHFPAAYEAVLSGAWNDYSLGNKDEARKLFERALMLSPGDTSAERGLSYLK